MDLFALKLNIYNQKHIPNFPHQSECVASHNINYLLLSEASKLTAIKLRPQQRLFCSS